MLWGDLGEMLELNDEEKDALRKRATKTREFIRQESVKIYKETLAELIDLVPLRHIDRVRRAFGETPLNWTPDLYQLAQSMFEYKQ